MKLTGSAFVLAALLAGAGVSVSANAATTSPSANCEQGHQNCMKELGTLERAVNGEKVKVVEGQTIRARFFNDGTELPNLETRVTILAGEEAHWSYASPRLSISSTPNCVPVSGTATARLHLMSQSQIRCMPNRTTLSVT